MLSELIVSALSVLNRQRVIPQKNNRKKSRQTVPDGVSSHRVML